MHPLMDCRVELYLAGFIDYLELFIALKTDSLTR
jgi:hypothetical protein